MQKEWGPLKSGKATIEELTIFDATKERTKPKALIKKCVKN